MADLVNPTVLSTGGLMGSGYSGSSDMLGGGGMLGGLLIGALLGNGGGGLFGGRNTVTGAGDVVTTAHLQSALNQQSQAQNTNNILQNLATIQQLIPEGTAAVQLSAAGNTFALSNQASQGQLAAANNSAQGQLQVAASTALLTNNVADARHNINDNVHASAIQQLQGQAAITTAVETARANIAVDVRNLGDQTLSGFAAAALGQANSNQLQQQIAASLQLQAANNTAAVLTNIRDDGERTRSLIIAQNDTYLNRIITEQANALIELRNERHTHARGRETEVNVSQTVNQAQAQNQAQQQQQQQFQILGQISAALAGLTQVAHATNQNVIAGNTGAVTTGPQSANPVNVA